MSEARRPPTLHDVARRAGVHPATVSRALSRPTMVAPATRSAVLEAVEEIGFVPNRSARQLVKGRQEAMGVVVPDITNPYFGSILRSIQSEARSGDRGDDLAVLVADTGADPDEERRALATLGRQVDGLVVITPITDLSSATVPVVQVNRSSRAVPSVVVDQERIAQLAIGHLTDLGHRHVAVVRGPSAYWSAAQRDVAVRLISRRRGLRVDVLGPAPATFDGGREVLAAVHRSGATGVVAFNDVQAAGLLVAAGEAGLDVPGSLSVVGSDGLDLATMTSPPLTTVASPLAELGRMALRRLTELLAHERPTRRTTLDPQLVVRGTTTPRAEVSRPTRKPEEIP